MKLNYIPLLAILLFFTVFLSGCLYQDEEWPSGGTTLEGDSGPSAPEISPLADPYSSTECDNDSDCAHFIYGSRYICCDHLCVDSWANGNCGACGVTCDGGEVCEGEGVGSRSCIYMSGCCMYDSRCLDVEDADYCIGQPGYINHWHGTSCSLIGGCETGCCFYYDLERGIAGACGQRAKTSCNGEPNGIFYAGRSCARLTMCSRRYGCCTYHEGRTELKNILEKSDCLSRASATFFEGHSCIPDSEPYDPYPDPYSDPYSSPYGYYD